MCLRRMRREEIFPDILVFPGVPPDLLRPLFDAVNRPFPHRARQVFPAAESQICALLHNILPSGNHLFPGMVGRGIGGFLPVIIKGSGSHFLHRFCSGFFHNVPHNSFRAAPHNC